MPRRPHVAARALDVVLAFGVRACGAVEHRLDVYVEDERRVGRDRRGVERANADVVEGADGGNDQSRHLIRAEADQGLVPVKEIAEHNARMRTQGRSCANAACSI